MHRIDLVDRLAFTLLGCGAALFFWAWSIEAPGTLSDIVLEHYGDWTPSLIIDGTLLLVLNRVIRGQERRRVINQVASLSNEFALDAVRRCREEGWLHNGLMAGRRYAKAKLVGADLSEARFAGADLSFADLSAADLTHADLRGVELKGANLSGADLRWADLTGACLSWADLRGAHLDGAILDDVRADQSSVDEEHADLPAFRHAVAGGFLSSSQQDLVRRSFDALLARSDRTFVRFYERLFQAAPQLRSLFSSDVERQARKFLQSLRLIVTSLGATERAAPLLQRLGERHRGYGVKAEHFQLVGGVLIETLDEALGDEFTDDVREAWTAAFRLIASIMGSLCYSADADVSSSMQVPTCQFPVS